MTAVPIERIPPPVAELAGEIRKAGGRAWLVGGTVRDLLAGGCPPDFDLEVYGLGPARLEALLARFGTVHRVGASFGVYKLRLQGEASGEIELDVALPRRERKTAAGHRGFAVEADPGLSPEQAARRRDFTINAMMLDPERGELLDFFGGLEDLERKVLRHVSEAFREDPLRVLRGMQFAARFDLRLDPATADLCRELLAEADTLPGPRIWAEWRKWALAPHPSRGLDVLAESGWLMLYPELAALPACPQDPRWHPEGDVWTHTRLAVDMAAKIGRRRRFYPEMHEALVFAVLCHDLGKPETTCTDANGRIRSRGHSEAGVPLALAFLERIHAPKRLSALLPPLIREHMAHMHGEPTPRAVRRLALRLQPAGIELWEAMVEADASGRSPAPPSRPAHAWLEAARALDAERKPVTPIARGRMLIEMGMKPGPAMGRLLKEAYEAQLDGAFADEDGARAWLKARLAERGTGQDDGADASRF